MKTIGLKILLVSTITISTLSADMIRLNSKDTVIDTNNRMMWEDKAKGATYHSNAVKYCEDLSLAGFKDWYLPSVDELKTLIGNHNEGWTIDPAFINDLKYGFWSTTLEKRQEQIAFYVYFSKKGIKIDSSIMYGRFASENAYRCVRQMQSNESININAVSAQNKEKNIKEKKEQEAKIAAQIIDKENGLIWQDDKEAKTLKMEWRFAKEYCEKKGDGWRLPATEELETLIDVKDGKPNLNKKLKNVSMRKYWTSKQTAAFTFQTLNFHYKNLGDIDNTNEQYGDVNVRCVKDMK